MTCAIILPFAFRLNKLNANQCQSGVLSINNRAYSRDVFRVELRGHYSSVALYIYYLLDDRWGIRHKYSGIFCRYTACIDLVHHKCEWQLSMNISIFGTGKLLFSRPTAFITWLWHSIASAHVTAASKEKPVAPKARKTFCPVNFHGNLTQNDKTKYKTNQCWGHDSVSQLRPYALESKAVSASSWSFDVSGCRIYESR